MRVGTDGRPAVCLRVAAAPVEGAANAALVALVARNIGLRRSEVVLVAGETARMKGLRLTGDPAVLAARIDDWIADRDRGR